MSYDMVPPCGHGTVYGLTLRACYGMAGRASHGVWYSLAGLACYIVLRGGHRMVLWYSLVGLAWDMVWQWRPDMPKNQESAHNQGG